MVDLSPGTDGDEPGRLFLDTIGLETYDYEENQRGLDRVARSADVILEGVPTDPHVWLGMAVAVAVADTASRVRSPGTRRACASPRMETGCAPTSPSGTGS